MKPCLGKSSCSLWKLDLRDKVVFLGGGGFRCFVFVPFWPQEHQVDDELSTPTHPLL